jgi:cobalamin biosynthesis protein CobT
VSAKLRAEVRRLFDNSGTSEWSLSRKTGAVHPGALASTEAGNVRPFKQRRDVEGVDSAVVLLIDVSSSMAGDRAQAAIPASIALLETLAAAGVDVCVMAFSSVCSIVKPWAMSFRKGMARMHRLKVEGGTRDYAALRHAHALLLRHPAQRRVVFSLSDGDGDVTAARAQNISAAALGITTIGVGIRHDVSAVYPQAVRVDNLADLGQVMFKHIKLAA